MLTARRTFLLVLGLLFSSCIEAPSGRPVASDPEPPTSQTESADNVVLVTLDGVRWQEIFVGADPALADAAALPGGPARAARALTPHLHHLFFEEGTVLGDPRIGEPLRASGPNFVSLPSYVEIMTGATSGCLGNECEPRISWTIAADVAQGAGAGQSAAVFASWERIARALAPDDQGVLVRAGRAPGEAAPPYPGNGEYRPDSRTAALAIEHLVHRRPRFLWVALGDTDEYAHRGDYRGYLEALRFADDFVGELSEHLSEMGDYGARTAVFVTTDHGRDAGFSDHGGPSSAGVWLMARGRSLPRRGSVALTRSRRLRDIAPTIAALLGEPAPHCGSCGDVLGEIL